MSRAFLVGETVVIHTWSSMGKTWRVTVVQGFPRLEEKCGDRWVMARLTEDACALLDGALHAFVTKAHLQYFWAKSEERAARERGVDMDAMKWRANANTILGQLERMPAPWNRLPSRER